MCVCVCVCTKNIKKHSFKLLVCVCVLESHTKDQEQFYLVFPIDDVFFFDQMTQTGQNTNSSLQFLGIYKHYTIQA